MYVLPANLGGSGSGSSSAGTRVLCLILSQKKGSTNIHSTFVLTAGRSSSPAIGVCSALLLSLAWHLPFYQEFTSHPSLQFRVGRLENTWGTLSISSQMCYLEAGETFNMWPCPAQGQPQTALHSRGCNLISPGRLLRTLDDRTFKIRYSGSFASNEGFCSRDCFPGDALDLRSGFGNNGHTSSCIPLSQLAVQTPVPQTVRRFDLPEQIRYAHQNQCIRVHRSIRAHFIPSPETSNARCLRKVKRLRLRFLEWGPAREN